MPSLLNGLSSLGSGVASYAANAGAEAQKADAAQALQASGGVIQGGLIAQRGALEAELARQAGVIAATNKSAELTQSGGIAATAASNLASTQAAARVQEAGLQAAAPTEAQKNILFYQRMGWIPGGQSDTSSASAQPPSSGAAPSGGSPPTNGAALAPPSGSVTPPAAQGSAMDNPLVRSAMGLPPAGSEAANRLAIAQDVKSDPSMKNASPGQVAAEIENRYQIATAKIADPATRDALATAIANYQLSPLDERARQMAGGPETMKKVLDINPDYQEGRYPEVNKALTAFTTGPQGDKTRFLNVGVQHLDVFDQAAADLRNGDTKALNSLGNYFSDQFGTPAPNTFNGLKQIVATEIEKAVAGGIGASADRDRLLASLNAANSPEQLQAMTNSFRALMAGQLRGLKTQYEDATPNTPSFRGSGQFSFQNKLDPATVTALSGSSAKPMAPISPPTESAGAGAEGLLSTPATPTAPTILRYDSSGNRIGAP